MGESQYITKKNAGYEVVESIAQRDYASVDDGIWSEDVFDTSTLIEIQSGYDEYGIQWQLFENGELWISGTGVMGSDNPWRDYINTGSTLRCVVVDEGITSISDGAFGWYRTVERVELPESLEEIGKDAFRDNIFTRIRIPSSVVRIGECAFIGCNNLKTIEIPSGVTKIEGSVFSGREKLAEIDLPDTIVELGDYAFCGTGLVSIHLPDSIQRIGDFCFAESGLVSMTIPYQVNQIGANCFKETMELRDLYFDCVIAPAIYTNPLPNRENKNSLRLHVKRDSTGFDEYPWNEYQVIYDN